MSTQMASPVPLPSDDDSQLHPARSDAAPSSLNIQENGDVEGITSSGRRSTSRLSRSNTQNAKDKETRSPPKSPVPDTTAGLDPLSKQIYLRTNSNTEPSSITQLLRNPVRPESPNADSGQGQTLEPANTVDATKDWRRGSSFLSRFSMRTPWMKDEDSRDSDSEVGEARDEGANARALTTVAGAGGGYIPFYKEPPRYIRVSRRSKKEREFNRLFLAQELSVKKPDADEGSSRRTPVTAIGSKLMKGDSAIWAAEFSLDGKYLAVSGKDGVVRIFSVISTPEERQEHEEEEIQTCASGEKLSAPVFRNKPVREYEGHTEQVLALSWSKNGFLLSCSMDKTVKLWHPSRPECLSNFQHTDLVTSIAFHPTDDRFFLAGSLDAQLRVWSIPDKKVVFSTTTTEFQTAVGFSPDGQTAICGLLSGMCMFFDTEGLQSQFQIHVRSSRGKNAKGSKITGIRTWTVEEGPEKGDTKVLISSNDSRVRIYSLKTRMLEAKFRGYVCQSSQIHARFSDGGMYVISGSEDKKAYIWGPINTDADTRDKQPYECFDAHPEVVTAALMAPIKSRQLLSASGDPIYDLCNPPPVTLLSLEESQATLSDIEQNDGLQQGSSPKKQGESPAYIERSKHLDGNIIITTDLNGTIKVFRQDCAHAKRQQNLWETGSKFSGKVAGGVGRSASIRTKASASSYVHSRRSSLIGASPIQQPSSDMINSWRQGIDGSLRPSRNVTPTRSERSLSPSKMNRSPLNTSVASLAADTRRERHIVSHTPGDSVPGSPASSTPPTGGRVPGRLIKTRSDEEDQTMPPTPSFSFMSIADSKDGNRDGSFWNLARWRGSQGAKPSASSSLAPNHSNSGSYGRRSLGVNDLRRLRVEESAHRRVSTGARLPSLSSQPDSAAQSIDERLEDSIYEQRPTSNQRDSGVGRISAESADKVDGAQKEK